jgi:hypothetical protein
LDTLLKGVARRGFDFVAAWRSVAWADPCLIDLLGELQVPDIDSRLHQKSRDPIRKDAVQPVACRTVSSIGA